MSDQPAIPTEALTRAAERVATEMRKHPVFDLSLGTERLREIAFELAAEALDAAAPAIRADERAKLQPAIDRVQRLAEAAQEKAVAAAVAAERERIAGLHDGHQVIWMPPIGFEGRPRPACRQCTALDGDERTFTPWPCPVLLGKDHP